MSEAEKSKKPKYKPPSEEVLRSLAPEPYRDTYAYPRPLLQKLKIGLMGITIMPIRLVTFFILLCLYCFNVWLLTVGVDLSKPISKTRNSLLIINAKIIARIIFFIGGYYWIPILGLENLGKAPNKPPIVISNHISYMDPALFTWFNFPSFIARDSIQKWPFIGRLIASNRGSFVHPSIDPNNPKQRSMADVTIAAIKERAASYDGSGPQTLLFPEGATTNGEYVLKFRKGAFTAGAPIQPILLRYPHKHQPVSLIDIHEIVWQVLISWCQFINYASIQVLPVYYPNEEEKADPLLYAKNFHMEFLKHTGYEPHPALLREKVIYVQLRHGQISVEEYKEKYKACIEARTPIQRPDGSWAEKEYKPRERAGKGEGEDSSDKLGRNNSQEALISAKEETKA